MVSGQISGAECSRDRPGHRYGLAVAGPGRASELLEQACSVLAQSPSRLAYARALVDLGAALRRAGDPVEARGALTRGLEMADSFGAVPLAHQARRELSLAGVRPRRTATSGVKSLTAAERRVADLAARGPHGQRA